MKDHNNSVEWQATYGKGYQPGDVAEIRGNTTFGAIWDVFPIIVAFDKHFTLEEAQTGVITVEKLLEDVLGRNKEDKYLQMGQ